MRTNGVIAPCDLARVRTLLHPRTEPGSNTRLFLLPWTNIAQPEGS